MGAESCYFFSDHSRAKREATVDKKHRELGTAMGTCTKKKTLYKKIPFSGERFIKVNIENTQLL